MKPTNNRRQADVLLIHPPWFRLQGSNLIPFPAGPCHIAAVLEKAGISSLVWNGDYDFQPVMSMGGTNLINTRELVQAHTHYLTVLENLQHPIWSEVLSIIQIVQPKAIGISSYTASYKSACNLARVIKRAYPQLPVVLGGIHPTIAVDEILSATRLFDVLALGESEKNVVSLFSYLIEHGLRQEGLASIKGIAYWADQIVKTEPAEIEPTLDNIPFPARHLMIDVDQMPPAAHQAIYGFRGCPYQCIFCASFNLFGRKPRLRSAASIVREMRQVHRQFGTKYFYICDDLFLYDRQRVLEFCRLLGSARPRLYFSLQTRGEMMDSELLASLKKAGCQHIAVGVEVGDEEIRKKIKKGNTVEQMRKASTMIRAHGLRMSGFFMFGFPWETKEHMTKTLDLMEEIDPFIAFPYIVTPAYGTELNKIAQQMELIPHHLDLSSFSHTSPKMGLTQNIPEEEKEQLIDHILQRFSRHNKRNLRFDFFRRPLFYFYFVRDSGILKSPRTIFHYLKNLF